MLINYEMCYRDSYAVCWPEPNSYQASEVTLEPTFLSKNLGLVRTHLLKEKVKLDTFRCNICYYHWRIIRCYSWKKLYKLHFKVEEREIETLIKWNYLLKIIQLVIWEELERETISRLPLDPLVQWTSLFRILHFWTALLNMLPPGGSRWISLVF